MVSELFILLGRAHMRGQRGMSACCEMPMVYATCLCPSPLGNHSCPQGRTSQLCVAPPTHGCCTSAVRHTLHSVNCTSHSHAAERQEKEARREEVKARLREEGLLGDGEYFYEVSPICCAAVQCLGQRRRQPACIAFRPCACAALPSCGTSIGTCPAPNLEDVRLPPALPQYGIRGLSTYISSGQGSLEDVVEAARANKQAQAEQQQKRRQQGEEMEQRDAELRQLLQEERLGAPLSWAYGAASGIAYDYVQNGALGCFGLLCCLLARRARVGVPASHAMQC